MDQLERGALSHETAATLIGVSPAELERLVQAALVRRNAKNQYAATALVQDYISHIRAGKKTSLLQTDIADHLDMSARALRELLTALSLDHETASVDQIRVAYIRRLREQASGRMGATEGGLDLVQERARVARATAEKLELEMAEKRGLLIHVDQVEPKWRAACIAAREGLLRERRRLAALLDGVTDRRRREDIIGQSHEAFLRRLADWRKDGEEVAEGDEP